MSNEPRLQRTPYAICPLCEGTSWRDVCTADCSRHPLYRPALPSIIIWRQCETCLHVFTDGYFSGAARDFLLEKGNEDQAPGYDLERQRYIAARIIDRVTPYADRGVWLDVGFGNAALLFTAREYGYTPVGLDLRSVHVDRLKAFGVESHCTDIKDFNPGYECRVISMADVLEHMPRPIEALVAARELLCDEGVLFLSMPNIESPVWKAMDDTQTNPYWGEIEHYHNFSRTRLYALLEETGFTPVRYGVSERYRAAMEVIAIKKPRSATSP